MPYTPTSNVLTAADQLVAAINAQWGPAAPSEAKRLYQTPEPTRLKSLTGRKVWLFPAEYGDEPATRAEALHTYRFGLVVFERYPTAGPVPDEWMDERVDWVAGDLSDWLNFGGDRPFLQIGDREVFTAEREPVQVYDPGELIKRNTFWSELEYVFQEVQ